MQHAGSREWPVGKYLLIDTNGQGHLPIRRADGGPEDRALMECAHAALTSVQGCRAKSYGGPRKEEATAKLRTAYEAQGIAWPKSAECCQRCQLPACMCKV